MHREGFISWLKLIEHRMSFYQGCSQLPAYQNNNNKILGLYRLSLPNFNLQVKVNYHNLQFLERKTLHHLISSQSRLGSQKSYTLRSGP